jgi:hypothetical protein
MTSFSRCRSETLSGGRLMTSFQAAQEHGSADEVEDGFRGARVPPLGLLDRQLGARVPPLGPPETQNLRRWRESGQARAWVEARHGRWGHEDWLGLLDTLRRSPFWPMQPEEVGRLLEETRQDWLRRQ